MKCNLVVGDEVVGKIPNGAKIDTFERVMFMLKHAGKHYVIDGVTDIDSLLKSPLANTIDYRLLAPAREENQIWIHLKCDPDQGNWLNAHFFQKVIKTDISVFEKILETAKKEKKIPVDTDA